jgi:hypothetical protein
MSVETVDARSAFVALAKAQVAEANRLANLYSAAKDDSDPEKQVHVLRETSDDETVVKFRQWYANHEAVGEEAVATIDAHIKATLLQSAPEIDADDVKAKYQTAKSQVKVATDALKVLGFEDALSEVPALNTLSGRTAGTSAGKGSGGKKPRLVSITVDGKDVSVEKDNNDGTKGRQATFTAAAQYMSKQSGTKVNVSDLQSAAFSSAGTDDFSTLNGKEISFYFEAGENDKRHNFHVVAVPRDSNAA